MFTFSTGYLAAKECTRPSHPHSSTPPGSQERAGGAVGYVSRGVKGVCGGVLGGGVGETLLSDMWHDVWGPGPCDQRGY